MWNQEDFINRVQLMADEKQTNLKAITRELEISASSFTDWKKGRGIPSIEKICKIADYFNVSLDYLVYGTTPVRTEISNHSNSLFSTKFNSLPSDYQKQVIGYMDGILTNLSISELEKSLIS